MRLLTEGKEDCALPLQDTVFVAAQQQVYLCRCKFRRQT